MLPLANFWFLDKTMRFISAIILALCAMQLCSCGYDYSRRVVQQGNLLPQAKINRLKIGMSKEDVAILMGTSLLSPVFNENRWDYAYTLRTGAASPRVLSYSLYFRQGALERVELQRS